MKMKYIINTNISDEQLSRSIEMTKKLIGISQLTPDTLAHHEARCKVNIEHNRCRAAYFHMINIIQSRMKLIKNKHCT